LRATPKGDDRIRAACGGDIGRMHEREQQIHSDWAPSETARRRQLVGDSDARPGDRPQAAGLRDGRRQLVPGDRSHPSLDDWRLQLQKVQLRCHRLEP
jgi:hypothetical protein